MIALYDAVFGFVKVIVFHLTERIAIDNKMNRECRSKLGFSYLAIPSRHEVPWIP